MFPVVTLAVTRSIVRDWLTDHYFSGYNHGFEPVSAGVEIGNSTLASMASPELTESLKMNRLLSSV